MDVRLIRLPELVRMTGMSGTTIWRHEQAGQFPRRRRVGPQLVAWRSDEVQAWLDALPVATGKKADAG